MDDILRARNGGERLSSAENKCEVTMVRIGIGGGDGSDLASLPSVANVSVPTMDDILRARNGGERSSNLTSAVSKLEVTMFRIGIKGGEGSDLASLISPLCLVNGSVPPIDDILLVHNEGRAFSNLAPLPIIYVS